MKTSFFFAAAFGALLTVPATSAIAQDAKAAEIIGKARKAIGGDRLDSLNTLTLQAATQRNIGERQMTGEVEMFVEMPDRYLKSEVSRGMMNMTMNTGFNGEKAIVPANVSMVGGGAMVIRMGPGGPIQGDAPKLTDEQKAEVNKASLRTARVELSRLMLGWFATAHPSLNVRYTYAGEAESPDGKAYVIDAKDADGFDARLFIDQNNYVPLMVAYKGRAPRMVTAGGPMRTAGTDGHAAERRREMNDEERRKAAQETEAQIKRDLADQPLVEFSLFFDDWREVDGIHFPHVMRRASGGETTEEWTISKVKFNSKIDAKKFAVETR